MGVSTKCGPSLGGPHKNRDYTLGSVLGSPSPFWKVPVFPGLRNFGVWTFLGLGFWAWSLFFSVLGRSTTSKLIWNPRKHGPIKTTVLRNGCSMGVPCLCSIGLLSFRPEFLNR